MRWWWEGDFDDFTKSKDRFTSRGDDYYLKEWVTERSPEAGFIGDPVHRLVRLPWLSKS